MEKKLFKNVFFTLCTLVISVYAWGETLPTQFHFSDDGKRLIRGNTIPNGFYNREDIDTIFITFNETNYWTLLTNNKNTSADLVATLKYKGVTYDSVGVRFKGLTSYSMVSGQKKSFNITLDSIKTDQNIEGYSTLNLNNAAEDASFLREFMYNYFQSKNVPCASTNYKVLMLNNVCWGIYVNVQQLDKQHAREWFPDADATRWRAISPTWSMDTGGGGMGGGMGGGIGGGFPPDSIPIGGGGIGGGFPTDSIPGGGPTGGGGGFGAGKSSLNYLGLDTTAYAENYTLKKAYQDNPWNNLVEACRVLNTVTKDSLIDSLSQVFDIDGALWFLAHEILFTDDDSYINKGGMDYYVYYDIGTERIIPIEFDGNSSFSKTNVKAWSPFYKEGDINYPLSNILLKVPELRQRYLAHVRTILEQSFNLTYCDSVIDKYAAKIDAYVKADTKKIFTYAQFKSEVTALKTFMSNRKSYYLSNKEVNVTGATISSVIYKAGHDDFSIPDSSQEVKVTCKVVADAGTANVYLYFDKGIDGKFTKVEMFDDGLHNDGGAGDYCYGGMIPAHEKGKYMRFYIESVAANTASTRTYSPAGAEHDVYIYRVKYAESEAYSDVVINEVMLSNSTIAADQDGEYDDWIELYNNSSSEVDLSGYYLTNTDSILTKWQIPAGTFIGGNNYLIVWCDKDSTQNGLHANFKLSAKGESVMLISPSEMIADEVICNSQNSEVSFSRIPNGYGPFLWEQPTYKSENFVHSEPTTPTSDQVLKTDGSLRVYPNPTSDKIHIALENKAQNNTLKIYNLYGQLVYSTDFKSNTTINCNKWTPGVYMVNVNNTLTKRIIIIH